jgi:hypothetical protein
MADAKQVFTSIELPASGRNLSFKNASPYVDFKLGDEQRVYVWDATPKSVLVEP